MAGNLTNLTAQVLNKLIGAIDPDTGHFYIDIAAPDLEIGGDLAIINSETEGKTVLAVSDAQLDMALSDAIAGILGNDSDTITDVVNAIESISFAGDTAIINSETGGKTKIKTTPDNPPNLNASISAVITAITNLGQVTATFTDVPVINPVVDAVKVPLVVQTELYGAVTANIVSVSDASLAASLDQKVHYIAIREAPSSSAVAATKTVPANASGASALSAQACMEVTIQAYSGNTQTILFGFYTDECYMELAAGKDFTIPVSNADLIYVLSSGNATQTLNYICRL